MINSRHLKVKTNPDPNPTVTLLLITNLTLIRSGVDEMYFIKACKKASL